MARSRLDLPPQELIRPGWFAHAVYEQSPIGGWRFVGYTKPAWLTGFREATDQVFSLNDQNSRRRVMQTWRWYLNDWYPV